ncbi:unnamed protein product (mitochondrion) [Plasmodiophora brassicae]|uniref:Uncharacterized protein n=1 Tax=Plasmodiophora brassicae TaxID=37360 RepID=A0A3P3YKB9_PLABS|nr:unnamed protein product [Plasmodiophora brassicae]
MSVVLRAYAPRAIDRSCGIRRRTGPADSGQWTHARPPGIRLPVDTGADESHGAGSVTPQGPPPAATTISLGEASVPSFCNIIDSSPTSTNASSLFCTYSARTPRSTMKVTLASALLAVMLALAYAGDTVVDVQHGDGHVDNRRDVREWEGEHEHGDHEHGHGDHGHGHDGHEGHDHDGHLHDDFLHGVEGFRDMHDFTEHDGHHEHPHSMAGPHNHDHADQFVDHHYDEHHHGHDHH